ncbi:hypothetical protein COLO4_07567 [Corchorus olitorius]|uniref:Uncharacterized protein n=1 Tax=Corchorus olitorius TaxID=93759 RepID=A0A1R3KJA3_9ROSI|nr:hypothetical protein COLO4_07567 [Corchorus olitorius]
MASYKWNQRLESCHLSSKQISPKTPFRDMPREISLKRGDESSLTT